jgi:hypothetical protein
VLLVAAFAGGIWFTKRKNRADPLRDASRDSLWGKLKTPFGVSELSTTGHNRAELQAHVPGDGTSYFPLSELPAHQQPVEMYVPPYKTEGGGIVL